MAKQTLKERLEKQRDDLKSRGGGFNFFVIKEGTTRFRHLPVGPEEDFAIEATYFYLGPEIKGVISPITFGGKCAIMEAYNTLSASKDPKERELATKIKPQKKFFLPSIKYKDEKGKEVDTDNGVKLLLLTSGSYQNLLNLYLDDETGDFTDPKLGYDIKYRRTGKGKNDTEYTLIPCKPTRLPSEYRKEKVNPEEMLKALAPSYKETKAILDKFLNLAPEEDEEDERPKKKKKKKDL